MPQPNAAPNAAFRCIAFTLLAYCCAAAGQSPKLLITHAHILTMAGPLDAAPAPIDGYLAVAPDGTILAVAAGDPPITLHAATTVDVHGEWIIPGFISAHSHLWQAAYRGLAARQNPLRLDRRSLRSARLKDLARRSLLVLPLRLARSPRARRNHRLRLHLRRPRATAPPSTSSKRRSSEPKQPPASASSTVTRPTA